MDITGTINWEQVITNLTEDLCKKFIDATGKKIDEAKAKTQIQLKTAFSTYLNKAYKKYSKIKTLLYRTEPKYIYSFFECNTLLFGSTNIDANQIKNILNKSHFVIIEGTGGIGKSTLLKHLFLNSIKETKLIPVFLELKGLNTFNGTLADFIYTTVNNLGFNLEKIYFDYALKHGLFIFLLDGYDEIISEKSDDFLNNLNQFSDKYEDNYYIMSSRPINSFISLQRFSVMEAQKFSKIQSLSLIKKLEYDEEIKDHFYKALDQSLYEKHTSFASNPLLLNIMLITFENYAEIPEKLHIFYANAFETLFFKHDATKSGYKREIKSNISYDEFKKIFANFCFTSYIKEEFEFDESTLINRINRFTNIKAEDYIYDLTNAICVLHKEGLKYRFTHRSFQEFFAALYIKDLSDDKFIRVFNALLEKSPARLWIDQTIFMLYDMTPERFESNIIIPHLKDIINNDFSEDKKIEILKKIAQEISFELDDNQIRVKLSHTHGIYDKEYVIFQLTKQCGRRLGLPSKKTETDLQTKMYTYLKETNCTSIAYPQVDWNDYVMTYIKSSWIYYCIGNMFTILQKLEELHNSISDDLDELLFV